MRSSATSISSRVVLFVALGSLCVAPSIATAALPTEKAVATLVTTAQGAVFGTLKQSLASAAGAFSQSMVTLDEQLALGADGPAAVEILFDDLVTLQTNVQASLLVAAGARANAMKDILAGAGVTTEGLYPKACYPGQGTQAAKFDAAVGALLTKTYIKLRKRMNKTIARIEAKATHVNVNLVPPRLPPRIWTSTAIDFFVTRQPSIDVVVASSTTAANADGTLHVAGEADFLMGFAGDVSVFGSFNFASPMVQATPVGGRYSADLGVSSLDEGVWLIGVIQDSGIPIDTTIGIR